MVRLDVGGNGGRDEIMDRKVLLNTAADVGGGDLDQRRGEDCFFESVGDGGAEVVADGRERGGGGEGERGGRAAEDGDVVREDVVDAGPSVELGELVGAQEECEASGGVVALEFVERVGGVARAGAGKLTRVDDEVRDVLDGQLQHREPVLGGGDGKIGFVR